MHLIVHSKIMKPFKRLPLLLPTILLLVTAIMLSRPSMHELTGQETNSADKVSNVPGIPFAWPFKSLKDYQPRGGETRGTEVTLADEPSDRWTKLQEQNLTKKEQDRRAILAMAGSYRVSFQFTETMGFSENYDPPRPYFSWATEHIRVLKSEENQISLQHIIVMYFQNEDGTVRGPHVMKHWRQDWTYEDPDLLSFQGNRTWKRTSHDPDRVAGHWTQTVYQVDDAPRYTAIGKWEHHDRFSIWKSEPFNRPLPRREFSVRDDYDLLNGTNTLTITPNGWVHEQTNAKVRLVKQGSEPTINKRIIARETGLNRYERITEPELSGPASDYWNKTEQFWRIVREEWQNVLADRNQFQLEKKVKEKKLHRHLFHRAARLRDADEAEFNAGKARAFVRDLLKKYVHSVDSERKTEDASGKKTY